MKIKIIVALMLLSVARPPSFAQIPFVYTVENTGVKFDLPVLRSLSQLPVVNPLTDPFAWSNGKGRSTRFGGWEKRRNEIKAEVAHYEIGRKPGKPETLTAAWVAYATNIMIHFKKKL